jgi:hypothetical protein
MTLPLPQRSVRFRSRIIDALIRLDAGRFWYLDENTVAGACPVCDGVLSVYFHGRARRAELVCHVGCPERGVAGAIRRLGSKELA